MSSEDERTIRRYLLQDLTESERKRVEERMMTDSDFFEEVTFAEDELVAEYARHALKQPERRKFEESFLTTPQGRQDLAFNRAVSRHISKSAFAIPDRYESEPRSFASLIRSFWRYQKPVAAFALAVMMALVTVSTYVFVMEHRRRSEIERLQAQMQQLERELADERNQASNLQQDLQAAQERNAAEQAQLVELENASPRIGAPQSPVSGILSVILSPGLTRGSARTQVKITHETREVEFRLRVASPDYERYNANVVTAGGETLSYPARRTTRMRSETQAILLLPAAKLAPGDYEIRLRGTTAQGKTEEIDSYYFAVVAK